MNKDKQDVTQETTEQFITNMLATLRNDDQIDSELLDILYTNILKMHPIDTALDDTVKAIEELATKRAEGSQNVSTDFD